jgi:hypothetical protein
MIGTGFLCLLGFGLGLGWWLSPTIAATLEGADVRNSSMEDFLPFIFPIFLPIALYLWGDAWRRWRNTRRFERNKQTTTGLITHLWLDPPRPPGKQYYVGYQFGEGQTAYQKVHSRTYSRLAVGESVTVEYAPDKPPLSRLDLQKRRKKRNEG